jgi:hypothetical protein
LSIAPERGRGRVEGSRARDIVGQALMRVQFSSGDREGKVG